MPKINSRAKGCRGEREWRDMLRAEGYEARRGQQFSGGTDSPDVICGDLPNLHFEVKRTEGGNPYHWTDQATRDAGANKLPVVAHKRNGRDWLVMMPANVFFQLLRETNQPLIHNNNDNTTTIQTQDTTSQEE